MKRDVEPTILNCHTCHVPFRGKPFTRVMPNGETLNFCTRFCVDTYGLSIKPNTSVPKSNQLLDSCKETYDRILSLLSKKNADYAGPDEAYKNFIDPELQAFFEKHNIPADAVEHGIRIRLKDKWSRINTLLMSSTGPAVADESLDDTIDDMIGYLGIWRAWRNRGK